MVDKSDEQRKKSLVKYLEGSRERFIRLLVLVKWAHYLPNLTNAAVCKREGDGEYRRREGGGERRGGERERERERERDRYQRRGVKDTYTVIEYHQLFESTRLFPS